MRQDVQHFRPAHVDETAEFERVAPAVRNSFVVVDADRVTVRALLFDVADGAARFIGMGSSQATVLPPSSDVATGIAAALRDVEDQSGRQFVRQNRLLTPQQADGDGVDAVYLTGSPMGPSRAAMIELGQGDLGRAVTAAIRRTHTLLASMGDDIAGETPTAPGESLSAWLRTVSPSTVVFVFNGSGTGDVAAAIDAVAAIGQDGPIQQGIVVGSVEDQQAVAQALGAIIDLSGIDPGDYSPDEIAIALEEALRSEHDQRIVGNDQLHLFSSAKFVDRISASGSVAAFLHRRMNRNILTISSGDGTLLQAVTHRGPTTLFRADLDLGPGARSLLRMPPELVARWLPFRWSPEEMAEWLLNRSLRPLVELEGTTDLSIAAALSRQILSSLVDEAGLGQNPQVDLIAVGPGLVSADRSLTALTVLDGIAPLPNEGVVTVALDVEGLMTSAGAISTDDPSFAGDVIEQDCLTPFMTCVIVTGDGEVGGLAVRGELTYSNGEKRRFSVPWGSLHLLPLPEGQPASLSLNPEPEFAVGAHASGESVSFEGDRQLFGGELGIVIDARGRPINLPDDPQTRVARIKSWIQDLGGETE